MRLEIRIEHVSSAARAKTCKQRRDGVTQRSRKTGSTELADQIPQKLDPGLSASGRPQLLDERKLVLRDIASIVIRYWRHPTFGWRHALHD